MEKTETLKDFYKNKLNWVPDTITKDVGHFNVFKLDDFAGSHAKPILYSRKDYFKISLIIGRNKIYYADKVIEIKKQALLFANPRIPYTWEALDEEQTGFFCVFTPTFFHQFGKLEDYDVFQTHGAPIFELTDEQTEHLRIFYQRMFAEINSQYTHKYDALRNLVFEILHYITKMQPSKKSEDKQKMPPKGSPDCFLNSWKGNFPLRIAGSGCYCAPLQTLPTSCRYTSIL